MDMLRLPASRDPLTGQTYVPPRTLAADGSLRTTEPIEVDASGTLHSATTFNNECYGIVDLDCGSRIQTLLSAGTDRLGERVVARERSASGQARFSHE